MLCLADIASLPEALVAALGVGFARPMFILLLVLYCAVVVAAVYFLQGAVAKRGKVVEIMAGVWSLLMYLSLGFVPMALRQWAAA